MQTTQHQERFVRQFLAVSAAYLLGALAGLATPHDVVVHDVSITARITASA